MKKIVVGMSGGVDSSVAAYLLKQQGFDVLGVFMKNWEDATPEPGYRQQETMAGCTWEEDFADVRAVCQQLDIPYTTFNFVEEYRDRVFDYFIAELKAGRTPNPDILCNQEIKFQLFLEKALRLEGVDGVATGHYAKIDNQGRLCRPRDRNKDQTYFLYRLDRAVLPRVVFPLADLTKEEVRAIAKQQKFPNADKKDSTGICFIGNIDYKQFIDQYIEKRPGVIQTLDGVVVGKHDGLHFYTIGQRRGINIGGTGPYYVVKKDQEKNILFVTNNKDDSQLFQASCRVSDLHWLTEFPLPKEADVQIRYRQQAQPAAVAAEFGASIGLPQGKRTPEGTSSSRELLPRTQQTVNVLFQEPQRAVTAGQSAVFYAGDIVLGGGIIQ